MSPIVNPVEPLADQPLSPLPHHSPDPVYPRLDDFVPQVNHTDISTGFTTTQSSTVEQYSLDGLLYQGWDFDLALDRSVIPPSNPQSILSEGGSVFGDVDHAILLANFDTQLHGGESLLAHSGTRSQRKGIMSPENRFTCYLDPSAVNVPLAGQTNLHGRLNVVLPMLAFLFATHLPQVRFLTLVADDADVTSSINECIEALRSPPQGFD